MFFACINSQISVQRCSDAFPDLCKSTANINHLKSVSDLGSKTLSRAGLQILLLNFEVMLPQGIGISAVPFKMTPSIITPWLL